MYIKTYSRLRFLKSENKHWQKLKKLWATIQRPQVKVNSAQTDINKRRLTQVLGHILVPFHQRFYMLLPTTIMLRILNWHGPKKTPQNVHYATEMAWRIYWLVWIFNSQQCNPNNLMKRDGIEIIHQRIISFSDVIGLKKLRFKLEGHC